MKSKKLISNWWLIGIIPLICFLIFLATFHLNVGYRLDIFNLMLWLDASHYVASAASISLVVAIGRIRESHLGLGRNKFVGILFMVLLISGTLTSSVKMSPWVEITGDISNNPHIIGMYFEAFLLYVFMSFPISGILIFVTLRAHRVNSISAKEIR